MEITIPSRKHGPRVLRQVGTVPHQLVSGEMIMLSVFRAECVKCQTRFYITTTAPVCDEMNPVCFGTVHCIGHRQWTTDNAIRRHAELAERFDTEDERARRQFVWDGSLSFASWPADADSTPGLEGWLVQQALAGKPGFAAPPGCRVFGRGVLSLQQQAAEPPKGNDTAGNGKPLANSGIEI